MPESSDRWSLLPWSTPPGRAATPCSPCSPSSSSAVACWCLSTSTPAGKSHVRPRPRCADIATRANPTVRWLARLSCWVFYRTDRVGPVPSEGPVLLLPNHPNSLLDPAVVWATAERDVRFLAKSTLFNGPFRLVLEGDGAAPVYWR